MIRKSLIAFFLVTVFHTAHAQFDTLFAKTNIRHCADSMAKGFRTKNWELYARYVHPALIGSMNGKAELIKFMQETFAGMPVNAWKQYGPGKILQVIKTEGDLQAVIELKSVLEWEGQRISTTTHLIAQSWDGGLFWTFFDSEGDREVAKTIKPDLSDKLNIPKKKEDVEMIKEKKN